MSFELKEGVSTEGLPTIKLGDQTLYVPRMKLRHRITLAGQLPKVKAVIEKMRETSAEISIDTIAPVLEMTRVALIDLYPSLTMDDLLDLDTDFDELNAAVPVLIKQATSRRASASDTGEAQATGNSTNMPGNGSSPTSA